MEELVTPNELENINELEPMAEINHQPSKRYFNKLGKVSYIKNGKYHEGAIGLDGSTVLGDGASTGSIYILDSGAAAATQTCVFANAFVWVKAIDEYSAEALIDQLAVENATASSAVLESESQASPSDEIDAPLPQLLIPGVNQRSLALEYLIRQHHGDDPVDDFDFSSDNGDFDF